MAVSFVASGTVNQRANAAGSTNTGDVLPTWPGTGPGDYIGMLAVIPVEIRSTNTSQPTQPSGWTKTAIAGPNTAGHGYFLWKVIDGTEANPLPISNTLPNRGVALACIHVFDGANLTTPFEDYQASSGATSPATGSTTTSTEDGAMHFRALLQQGGVGLMTPPSGWSESADFNTGSGDDASLRTYYQVAAVAGALSDPDYSTGTVPMWAKIAVVIKPSIVAASEGFANISGTWKAIDDIYVHDGASFVLADKAYVNDGGTWKQFWSA